MSVAISSFGGIIPRADRHRHGITHAFVAHDAKLRNGRLEAWREPAYVAKVPEGTKTLVLDGCCFLPWNNIVHFVRLHPDWNMAYLTGNECRLQAATVSQGATGCTITYYNVGVPAPTTPPSASGPTECSRASDARSYVYTYVNEWGEEGPPSAPSSAIVVEDGASVQVAIPAMPPDGHNIAYINIYRSATGFRQTDAKIQNPISEYLFVGTLALPSAVYTDSVPMRALGFPLETLKVRMPPSNMLNVVNISGVVRMAGSWKKKIYMSEPFQPYNWPAQYDITLDDEVLHMFEQNKKLFVTTDSRPYIIDVSSCDESNCAPVTRLNFSLPDISLNHRNSAIMTPHGLIYSSHVGAVLLDGGGNWHNITAKWFGRDEWAKVKPTTARFAYWDGFLFIITDTASFVLDIDGRVYADTKEGELVTISDRPTDVFLGPQNQLFLLYPNGDVKQWDSGADLRKFFWESCELSSDDNQVGSVHAMDNPSGKPHLGVKWAPNYAKIRSDTVDFTLLTPIDGLNYKRRTTGEVPFRFPKFGRHPWYRVRLEGTSPVEFLTLGTSLYTVNRGE